jgi:putative DNA primase/helicase
LNLDSKADYGPTGQNGNGTARDDGAASGTKTLDLDALLALKLPPREFVLEPILRQKETLQIFAWRGVGKTNLAMEIAYGIATGARVLRWAVPKARRVVYVDGELPQETVEERFKCIDRGHDARPTPGFLRIWTPDLQDIPTPNLSLPEHQQRFDEKVIGDAEVVIFDSVTTLFRLGRETDDEAWQPVQDWLLRLRRRGVTVIFLHHEGKNGGQRGTSKRDDILDVILQLKRPADYAEEEGCRFEVVFKKYRNLYGTILMPFDARMEICAGAAVWKVQDIDPRMAEVAALNQQGKTVRQIETITNIPRSTVQRIIARLADSTR